MPDGNGAGLGFDIIVRCSEAKGLMSVYSMTGYASAAAGGAGEEGRETAAVTVEARSVNGRVLDLAFRLPDDLRGLEPALRELLGAAFRRGNVPPQESVCARLDFPPK